MLTQAVKTALAMTFGMACPFLSTSRIRSHLARELSLASVSGGRTFTGVDLYAPSNGAAQSGTVAIPPLRRSTK